MSIFATKSIEQLKAEASATGEHALKRVLGPVNLVTLGIGAVIGTGIFVLSGTTAADNAGPAIVLSMVLAGTASALAGLCYSEFASTVPIAGSAYTYGYATLGELVAWVIGWDLILEYALGAATVAVADSIGGPEPRHAVAGAVAAGVIAPFAARVRRRPALEP
jgi:APA family basic amino acid/polyamine antiporter